MDFNKKNTWTIWIVFLDGAETEEEIKWKEMELES